MPISVENERPEELQVEKGKAVEESRRDEKAARVPLTSLDLPAGCIRQYEHARDSKVLRFLIGSNILSLTAVANQRQFWGNRGVYVWTIGFTLYVALHSLASSSDSSLRLKELSLAFLLRLPLFFAPPLILLALINALNRSYFRAILVHVLSQVDLREPSKYYANTRPKDAIIDEKTTIHPSMWVLDYDSRQLGMIAIDTSLDGFEELIDPNKRTILIRHLATAPDFRPVGIDYDLLVHACSLVFGSKSNTKRLAMRFYATLDDHLVMILKQLGFTRLPHSINHSSTTLQHQPFFKNKTLLKLLGWSNPFHPWPQETWVLDRENLHISN